MQKLRTYIVEDMAFTRIALEEILKKNGFDLVGSSASAEKAWEDIENGLDIDLILVDIHLAGENDGLWLAKQIRAKHSMALVYLTAFGDQETLSKLDATKPNGYLMKPYNTPTLLTTIKIALNSYHALAQVAEQATNGDTYIFVKDGKLHTRIQVDEILFIQSEGNYLNIYTKEKKFVIRSKMNEFLKENTDTGLIRTHLRYLVNRDHLTHIGTNLITILQHEIPISKAYRNSVLNILNN
ncbi:MAG: response regulator transcription factor [Bacteroidia bacterium]